MKGYIPLPHRVNVGSFTTSSTSKLLSISVPSPINISMKITSSYFILSFSLLEYTNLCNENLFYVNKKIITPSTFNSRNYFVIICNYYFVMRLDKLIGAYISTVRYCLYIWINNTVYISVLTFFFLCIQDYQECSFLLYFHHLLLQTLAFSQVINSNHGMINTHVEELSIKD